MLFGKVFLPSQIYTDKKGGFFLKRKNKEIVYGYLYIIPSLILILIFYVLPIFMTIGFSFTDYNVINSPVFTGIKNYSKIITDDYIITALKNTLIYVIVTVPLQTFFSVILAGFLAYKLKNRFGSFLRSAIFIPVIVSAVTSGRIWKLLLGTDDGLVNNILGLFHIQPVNWLGSSQFALVGICIVAIWKNVGYFMIIYYAGMMDVSKEILEATRVDGATGIQQFFKIVLPIIKPISYLVITLGIIWSFQVFDIPYVMTGGGPGKSTVTLVMGIYNSAFKDYKMGYACALSILLLLVIIIINAMKNIFFKEEK